MGGAAFQKSFQDWQLQHSNLYSVITLLLLGTLILFSSEIPPLLKAQANTLLGRALLLVALYFAIHIGGWFYGCMTFIAIALLLAPSREVLPEPATLTRSVKEGFSADVVAVRDVPRDKERWFVEKVLKEEPERIEEDRVLSRGDSQ